MTSALDMPEIMSYIYSKSWKLQFSASSSIIIIEDYYLQTFLHSLVPASEEQHRSDSSELKEYKLSSCSQIDYYYIEQNNCYKEARQKPQMNIEVQIIIATRKQTNQRLHKVHVRIPESPLYHLQI